MEITVLNKTGTRTTLGKTIERAIGILLEQYSAEYGLSKDIALNVVLCDNAFIRDLNRQYRNTDRETDVLAFSMRGGEGPGCPVDELGDIVISMEQARLQAAEVGWGIRREILLLLVHGFLHLLGYNDETSNEVATMRALERTCLDDILRKLNLRTGLKGGAEA